MIYKALFAAATTPNFYNSSAKIGGHSYKIFYDLFEAESWVNSMISRVDGTWFVRAEIRIFHTIASANSRLVWKYSTRRKLSLKKPEWAKLPILEN